MRLLVAEDDLVLRFLLEELVTSWGHQVCIAEDGAKALELVGKEPFDAAILDWMMPGVAGVDVCRAIRAQEGERHPFVLMLTAKTTPEDIVAGLDAGADEYLAKPYNPSELAARVRAAERFMRVQDQLIEARKLIAFQAKHDLVTSLWNRSTLMDSLHAALRERSDNMSAGPYSVLRFSMDGAREFAEAQGPKIAGELLKSWADQVVAALPPGTELGHLERDQLLVLLPDVDEDGVEALAREFAQSFSDMRFVTSAGTFAAAIEVQGATAAVMGEYDENLLLCALDASAAFSVSRVTHMRRHAMPERIPSIPAR